MGKEYAPWSEARLTIFHAVKKPELTLLWEEFNSPAKERGHEHFQADSKAYENHIFRTPERTVESSP
ncbi:MAG: hypothetical protein B6245_16900 [Desulfobacteraceae bacterium 4572_88]|nr:MAG: hypothetical protein B6245_16900 [Desulfobacteraceae bacterium 4572_88]